MADSDDMTGLRDWVRDKYGPDAQVTECDKGAPGFSNETWLLTVQREVDGDVEDCPLVLRKAREEIKFFPHYDLDFQYRILESLSKTGVPAPAPVAIEHDSRYIGTPFYLMERIAKQDGVVPIDGPPSGIHGMGLFFDAPVERRTKMWRASLESLAKVHEVDPRKTGLPFAEVPTSLREVVENQLAIIDEWHRYGSPEPLQAISKAVDRLRNDIPDQDRIVLCWGDAKPGNLVFVDDGVAGVLDWEMAYLGTPEMDVMYWIITDDVSASTYSLPRLEGCLDRDETLRYYEQVSGYKLQNLDYHELFQTLRLAVLLVLADRVVTDMGIAEYFPQNWSTNNEPYRRLQTLT